ncbi:hypothetical protein CYMTET_23488 [Cymbomonas tetramitiformis]|uniref:Thioesterase domain-containing protein n=1 Tax=Cymbomonas tetramitiformis TaxID=36881 RepID=A0AAE0FYE5_9CHLO|nr:hypothetical protein CYMTET_23488 [Cymbomonas tetramitiformis]
MSEKMRTYAIGSAAAVGVGLALWTCFYRKPKKMTRGEALYRVEFCESVFHDPSTQGLDASVVAGNFNLKEVDVGLVKAAVKVVGHLSDPLGGLSMPAATLLVETCGSYSAIAAGLYPGVTTDLTVEYFSSAKAGATVTVEGKLMKGGRNLAWAETSVRDAAGNLLVLGRQTLFVGGRIAQAYAFVTGLPNFVRVPLMKQVFSKNKRKTKGTFDTSTDLAALPESAVLDYYRNYAKSENFDFIGYDKNFTGGVLLSSISAEGSIYDIKVPTTMRNYATMMHGAASAALVDNLATAGLVRAGFRAGATANLNICFLSGASSKAKLVAETKVLHRGKHLAHAEVMIRCARTKRLHYKGIVSKYAI